MKKKAYATARPIRTLQTTRPLSTLSASYSAILTTTRQRVRLLFACAGQSAVEAGQPV